MCLRSMFCPFRLVALRKESVDRNRLVAGSLITLGVALRKESVDRNHDGAGGVTIAATSLSARRAWIEIVWKSLTRRGIPVALRKESVDRNKYWPDAMLWSLVVALRKESVDRNGM